MLLTFAYAAFDRARNGPFAFFADKTRERQVVQITYNDVNAPVRGHRTSCLALIERDPNTHQVNVCFAPNRADETSGKACPVGSVAGMLATGLYKEMLKSEGYAPHQVRFYEHSPRIRDTNPSFMDRGLELPSMWRKLEMTHDGNAFEVVVRPKAVTDLMIDPAWQRNVPRVIKQFPEQQQPSRKLDLGAYTPYRANQKTLEEVLARMQSRHAHTPA